MKKKRMRLLCVLLVGVIFFTGSITEGRICLYAAEDAAYTAELKKGGFPNSYVSALNALHKKYPKWKFEAVQTGLDWSTVIQKESINGVNLVPKSGNDATKSTAAGAYDWTTNQWTIFDGSSWVGANPKYISYYMDPRNFLNETDIFQFEGLSYSKSQTIDGVSAILKDTFMEQDVEDADGRTLNYAQAFMDIGKKTGVSPYHLATRVRQEQGLKGTSALISGTYEGYEGYYNYFNNGASGITSTSVIKNGLAFAKKSGWDTRYASLEGGAKILASKYISVGQDTLYFQKFNVVNKSSLYGHQYMQNVTAAYYEGKKLGQGYSNKNQAFVFRIPVYKSMPEKPVSFTATGNPNNYLKSLTVKGNKLTPSFKGATTKYSLVVGADVTSVNISAVAVAPKSTVSGTGTKTLKTGTNKFSIKCKSESGSTKTYTLTIERKKGDGEEKIPVSGVYQVGKDTITGIEPGTKAAAFLKNIRADGMTMKLVKADGSEQKAALQTGDRLKLYDTNKKELSSYNIIIYGDVNGDGSIDSKDVKKLNAYLLGKEKLSGCFLTAADTNRKGDGVTVLDLVYLKKHVSGTAKIRQ